MLYKNVQKTVVRANWKWAVTPFYMYDNANGEKVGTSVATFFAKPNLINFIRCAFNAVLG